MNQSMADDLQASTASDLREPATQAPLVRIDFGNVSDDYLLVFGWVLGLFRSVSRAEIRHGEVLVDLLSLAVPVPRPDVTAHFAGQVPVEDDFHGFCLLVPLPESRAKTTYLRLSVMLHSGERIDRVWPLSTGSAAVAAFVQQHRGTFDWLVQHLPPADATRVRRLAQSGVGSGNVLAVPVDLEPKKLQLPIGIDFCGAVDGNLLVLIGHVAERDRAITAATMKVGATDLDMLPVLVIQSAVAEGSTRPVPDALAVPQAQFTAVLALRAPPPSGAEANIEMAVGSREGRVRRVISDESPPEDLRTVLRGMDSDEAISLLERLVALRRHSTVATDIPPWLIAELTAAVERLPVSLQNSAPQFYLHFDGLIPIAAEGVYLTGWFRAASDEIAAIDCCSGFERQRVDATWMRRPRPDVVTHLASLGIAASDNELGFACYVNLPLRQNPLFIAVTTRAGVVRRMRLVRAAGALNTLQTVRGLLSSFQVSHRDLGRLLDSHIGPAVAASWSSRPRGGEALAVQNFGPAPVNPRVSVIVPLFGRADFAELQMAVFADDPEISRQELIYFVDDPAIYDAFRAECHGLYEIYRVPFRLAFAGANLGFAGANNRAAEIARARHLLLLNSDVFPKNPGWIGAMLAAYAELGTSALLGAKLLYEDGSVQHAGIEFRRHPPWGDLWINAHPHKGLSALGLTGMRRVPAVTAACLLVEAEVYRRLGGLSEDYIIGDFEDSDLCLRAAAAGYPSWVALDIELYHLERQSQDRSGDAQWRTNLTAYNCWQHDRRWSAQIESSKT
jgi:GT2 family glycosyltransferase